MIQFTSKVEDTGSDLFIRKPKAFESAFLILLEQSKSKCAGYLNVRFDLPHRPRRTGYRSGSAHFHGHCQTITEDTGNDFEDVKLYLKRRAMRQGYPTQYTKDGNVRYSLVDGLPVPQSEADASIEQENMLIKESHILAAELNVKLIEYEKESD